MSKKSLTLCDLIELINISVKSGKIKKDYHDFLKSCRDLGVSSYVLNTIILKVKEDSRKYDDNYVGTIDHTFFVSLEPEEEQPEDFSEKEQKVKIEQRKNSKTARLVVLFLSCLFLSCLCVAEVFYMYKRISEQEMITYFKNNVLDSIADMSNLPADLALDDWHTTEKGRFEKSYDFTASKGDVLTFDSYVSSRSTLEITLIGDSIPSIELVEHVRRFDNWQGTRTYTFARGGTYQLRISGFSDEKCISDEYSINPLPDDHQPDDVYRYDIGKTSVSNIRLRRNPTCNYKKLIDEIHSISIRGLSNSPSSSGDAFN